MNLDNELKTQNPFKRDQQSGWMSDGNNTNFLQGQNNNINYDENNPFQNNEIDQYSGYMNEVSNIGNEDAYNQEIQIPGYSNVEGNQQGFNQHLMDYQPGTLDGVEGLSNQYQQGTTFYELQSRGTETKLGGKNKRKQNQGNIYQTEQQLEKYEKVSEYLLQADNHSLNGIRNILTYLQNRNFLYNERRCLEILHANNQIFNFDAYKCTMIMCGILLDASVDLIKDQKFYLAEKYLLRAKNMTEPNEKHLKSSLNQLKYQKIDKAQLDHQNSNNQDDNYNNQVNENNSEEDEEDDQDEEEEMIFENDIRYHDIRIEIALNLSNIYKKQMKNLKKKRKNLQKKKPIQFGQKDNRFDETGNEIGGMKEIKEEHELEMELEKYDNNNLNTSPPNFHLSQQQSPSKDKQVFFSSNISHVTQTKQKQDPIKGSSIKGMMEEVDQERKDQFNNNKDQNTYQQLVQIQKQKEMDEEEEKDEEEKQGENKMEQALRILNEVESKLTDNYIELSKQDLKGTLCKFYQKKVEILNELLKYADEEYSEEEVEEMSKEMLKCAQFVIGTLESILLPLKVSESVQSQADSVFLATILSYTWTKLGKYLLKTKDIDKAVQCYKNAYERLQNFFREGNDRIFLQDKFKRKYDKFRGKLAFERIGDGDIIEFSQFEDDINFQTHLDNIQTNKKNYLTSSYGLPTTTNTQGVAGQFYVDPEYLNQLKSHHTVKSLNKHRHLKKIPISHPFGSSLTSLQQQQTNISHLQQNNTASNQQSQQQQQQGRSFKFKKNLQLQLENYKNQILGMNTPSSNRTAPQNLNNNNNSTQIINNAVNPQIGLMDFSVQPKTTGAQIELSPDEKNIPFMFPSQKIRQHPQSAKVRSANSARRHYSANEDQSSVISTNLGQPIQGQQAQQNQKQSSIKQGLHRKTPSLTNTITKASSQNSGQKLINEISKNSNLLSDKMSNSQAGGIGLSYNSVPSSRREYNQNSMASNSKFINQNQDDPQAQQNAQQQRALFTSQGYFHKKRKDDQSNSQYTSLDTMKQVQFGNQSRFPISVSSSILMKSIQSPKQYSLHQQSLSQQGLVQQKRVMSARNNKGGITNTISIPTLLQQSQLANQNQMASGIESESLVNADGINSTNKMETLNSARNQDEIAKIQGSKFLFSRNNSVTNEMLDNIVNFVDSMYDNPQKNVLNSTKSTASTSNRNMQVSKRPSSSNIYFSTSRLFSNTGSQPQLLSSQKAQNQMQDQTGIIYEGYEGNDQSITQNVNEPTLLHNSNLYGNSPYYEQYHTQKQQNLTEKFNQQGNKFIVINAKPSKSAKNAENIMNTMGNLRLQLNNLFDQNNQIKVQPQNAPSSNIGKYSIKLNPEQKEQFIDMINRRPSQKQDQNITSRTGMSTRKNSNVQPGQISSGNYEIKEEEEQDDVSRLQVDKQQLKNMYKGGKHQTRNSIKLPFQHITQKQIKSLTYFDDQSKNQQSNTQSSGKQVKGQEKRNDGSSRRINTIDKSKNKDISLSKQQQQGQQMQQQIGSNMFIQLNQNTTNNNQQLVNSQNAKNIGIQQNPSLNMKEKGRNQQNLLKGGLKIVASPLPKRDNQNEAQMARNIITQSVSVLKKKNTENYHDSSMISVQQPILQHNQVSNQENSRILKSGKQSEQVISNKSGLINNSKIEDKQLQKPKLRRLSTNITDSVFKRQPTANYEQNQIELPPIQTNNEDEKRLNSHFTSPFIKQKFDQFQNMNTGLMNKDQNKINETYSSQEDDDDEDDDDDEEEEEEQETSNQDQQQVSQQIFEDLQPFNGVDDLRGGGDDVNNNGDEQRKQDKRLGNSMNLRMSQGNKVSQQSPDISRMMGSQQQQQDNNKSFPHHLQLIDQASSSLHQSFHQQQGNYYSNITQSNQGLNDKSLTQNYPNVTMNMSQPNANAQNSKGMTVSQNQGKLQQSQHHFGYQSKDQLQTKTLYYPSIKEQKYKNLRKRIKQLLFVPMYFYKSYNSYSLCQWNVTNISISLKSVCEEGDAENVEQLLQQFDKKNQNNKGGIPLTSDKIRYDIKLSIFLECNITDQHIINNPLIFHLKDQPLNYVDHLWPNDKQKIETKYEFAILLLDRWIKERDINVIEELYDIELAYQKVQIQFVLRGGEHYKDLQKIIEKEQSSPQNQFGQSAVEKFDQIRLFGIKLNFIINKIAKVVKRVHGDIIRIPYDMNEINSLKLSVRQTNLQSLRDHQVIYYIFTFIYCFTDTILTKIIIQISSKVLNFI